MSTQLQVIVILLIALTSSITAEDIMDVELVETENSCNTKKEGCCSELYLGIEADLMRCYLLHQSKLPIGPNTLQLVKFLSCFVECQYKHRKYIGKEDTINMKVVKSDAEKLYPDRPKESEYYVEMFDFCRTEGKKIYDMVMQSPGGRILLNGSCKPYLMFVYICNAEYHKKHTCPYFRWEGKQSNKAVCSAAKEKCYALDGIST